MVDQFVEGGLQLHQGLPEALDLLLGEVAGLHAAQRLALHELAEQLDEREHELGEPALGVLGVGLDAAGQRVVEAAQVARERVQVDRRGQHLVGGRAGRHSSTNE